VDSERLKSSTMLRSLRLWWLVSIVLSTRATNWLVNSNSSYFEAFRVLSNGDTITIQEGTYSGSKSCDVVVSASNVTIRAELVGKVIIDCNSRSRHFSIFGQDVRIQGLSLINGFAEASGGCIHVNESGAILEDCTLERCFTYGNGGGVALTSARSELLLRRTTFQMCSASNGGGIFVNTSARVRLLQTGLIQNCTSSSFGGGIYLSASANASINAENYLFLSNTANSRGGAVYMGQEAHFSFSGTITFSNNGIAHYSTSAAGGALFATASSISVALDSAVHFRQNYCICSGGALALFANAVWQARGNVSLVGVLLSFTVCKSADRLSVHDDVFLQGTRQQLTGVVCI
jgi:predicted outer membrane repeat protein